jgi:hypothetical protein
VHVAYTGTDGRVYLFDAVNGSGPAGPTSLGGSVVGGPALVVSPDDVLPGTDGLAVFARGTDDAVWWKFQTQWGWSSWASLGGVTTASPAAAAALTGQFGQLVVVARGPGGNLWMRNFVAGAWTPWHHMQGGFQDPMYLGPLLAGTGPGVAYGSNGEALVTAADRFGDPCLEGDLYGWTLFCSAGHTTFTPAVTATAEHAVVFIHGSGDDSLWAQSRAFPLQDEHLGPWTSLGGRLTSAVSASTAGSLTAVVALGTDNRIWMRSGTWPTLGPWHRVG